ncbi:MAG TPA: hypothetical protein VEW45_08230 [Candidatus Dormibacteraeota bacterium]|nr:hypothetical protein [Candidatus Dormibacteraeota bacterium]
MPERHAPLVLVVDPASGGGAEPAAGSYAAAAFAGQQLLAAELSQRFGARGAAVAPLVPVRPAGEEAFHWGRWFTAAAQAALEGARATGRPLEAIGYAGAGALALGEDALLDELCSAVPNEVVANNRYSADAFVVAGDLDRALGALALCPTDNAAVRCLEAAGWAWRDLSHAPWARFDVDTPLDLALLCLATRLPGTRRLAGGLATHLEEARLPGVRRLEVPHVEAIGAVLRDRESQLVVAGRLPSSAWAYLETESACRVRCFIEERGMRSAPDTAPRSMLADWVSRLGPGDLVRELATLGDAVILDTRVLMAALAGSSDAASWPAEEERFASDFLDAEAIATPWLAELTAAAASVPIPFLLGGHALVSDGLRILVDGAWLGR